MSENPQIFDRALLNVRRNRVAKSAPAHDFLLARASDDIADRLQLIKRDFKIGLNLGAHHGLLSRRIRSLPNVDTVFDADGARGLIAQADGPNVCCDEEMLPIGEAKLDLVASALALQWVNDLPGTFAQVARALKPDGLFLAAMIGGETLKELRHAFLLAETEFEGGASPHVAPMTDLRDLGGLAQRTGFALPVVDSDIVTVTYESALDLMRELRAMGASNVLRARRRVPMRRETLARAAAIYEEMFACGAGRVAATFEILTLTAWSPHESQQKPLRPGSAKARLADALGVEEHDAGDKPGTK